MNRTSGPHGSCRDTRTQTQRSRKVPRSRTSLFESDGISSSSALRWGRKVRTDRVRPYRTRIHTQERNRNECPVATQPQDSITELQSSPMFVCIVLMEIDICGATFTRMSMRIRREHRLLKPSRKCHSLQRVSIAAQHPDIGNALDLAVDDGLQVCGRFRSSGHVCLGSLRKFCSLGRLYTRIRL